MYGPMYGLPNKAAEYRRNATICLTMARQASAGDRAVLLEIAQDWTDMAAACDSERERPVYNAAILPFPHPG
jgi:hypothetical protein